MRILHITRDLPPSGRGGISTAVGGMVAWQREQGHEVAVVSFDDWRPRRARALAPVVSGGTFRLSDPAVIPEARAWAVARGAEVVHLHHAMLHAFSADVAAQLGVPWVKTVHVLQHTMNALRGVPTTMSSEAQQKVFAGADALLCPSTMVAEEIGALEAEWRAKCRLAPLGIAVPAEVIVRPERDRVYVGYVGRFADVKGTDVWLEAAAVLAEDPRVRLVTVGGLPSNPKAERRWLRRWEALAGDAAARMGFHGWSDAAHTRRTLEALDIVVVPSRVETFGMVVLEAMAAGAAVIAAKAPAITELVDHGHNGLLVDRDRSDQVIDQVLALASKADLRRALGRAGRTTAAGFVWDAVGPETVRVYAEVCGGAATSDAGRASPTAP